MTNVHIKSIGLNSEYCDNLHSLHTIINSKYSNIRPSSETYKKIKPRLNKPELQRMDREDRPILNELSISILNAINDMLDIRSVDEDFMPGDNTPLFTGSGESVDDKVTRLGELFIKYNNKEDFLNNIGLYREITHPLAGLKNLATNHLYHTSKRLKIHGGGYPVNGSSLSGLCALEDAFSCITTNQSKQAVVVASGNMKNFDSLTLFSKLGLVEDNNAGSVNPSFGSASMILEANNQNNAFAQILAVSSLYNPKTHPELEDWVGLMRQCKSSYSSPDYVVSYANGVKANDESECSAISSVFPNTEIKNYKNIFGYTSMANNLLDLSAVIADESIEKNATILINGAGLNFGLGYILIKKSVDGLPKFANPL